MESGSLILVTEAVAEDAGKKGYRLIDLDIGGKLRKGLFFRDFSRLAKSAGLSLDNVNYFVTQYEGVFEFDPIVADFILVDGDHAPVSLEDLRPGQRIISPGSTGRVVSQLSRDRRGVLVFRDTSCSCYGAGCCFSVLPAGRNQKQCRLDTAAPVFRDAYRESFDKCCQILLNHHRHNAEQTVKVCGKRWHVALNAWMSDVAGFNASGAEAQEVGASVRNTEDVIREINDLWKRPDVKCVFVEKGRLCVITQPLVFEYGDSLRSLGQLCVSVSLGGKAPLLVVERYGSRVGPKDSPHPLVAAKSLVRTDLEEALTMLLADCQYVTALSSVIDYLTSFPEDGIYAFDAEKWPIVEAEPSSLSKDKLNISEEQLAQLTGTEEVRKEPPVGRPNLETVSAYAKQYSDSWVSAYGHRGPSSNEEDRRKEFELLCSHDECVALHYSDNNAAVVFGSVVGDGCGKKLYFGCLVFAFPWLQEAGKSSFVITRPSHLQVSSHIHPLVDDGGHLRVSDEERRSIGDLLRQGRLGSAVDLVLGALKHLDRRRHAFVHEPLDWPIV